MVNLFKTWEQTKEINKLFLRAVGIDINSVTDEPIPLYSEIFAQGLAYQSSRRVSRIT